MITLKDIYLENFMAIDSLFLEFDDDVVMSIYGQNGSGKSTLIYAIAFAITGYRYGESYRDYVTTGADLGKVVLNATLNGKPIKYDIEIKGKNKSGSPIKRNVLYDGIEYLNSDYNQFMKEHELDTIENLMFLFQGNKDIIESKPAERASMLKKLFQFDFDGIINTLKEQQIQEKDNVIRINAVINELKSRVFECAPLQREALPAAINNWEERLSKVESTIKSMENIDEDTIQKCESSLEKTKKEIATFIQKISYNQNIVSQTEKAIHSIEGIIKKMDLNELNKELEDLNEEISNHKKQFKLDTEKYHDIQNRLQFKTYEINELDRQIKISETGVCHACGQAIDEEHVESLYMERIIVNENIREIKEEANNFSYDPDDKMSAALENKKNSITAKIREYESNSRDLKNLKSNLLNYKDLLETQESYLSSLNDKLKKLTEESNKNEDILPLIQHKESILYEQNQLIQSITNAKNVIISNEERKRNNALIQEEESKRNKKVEELSLELNNTSLDMENLKASIDVFENLFPNFIILQACNKLEDYINGIVQKLFPYMRVCLKQNRSGVNFYYTIGESSEELAVCMASGAQKMILSLAYSVALARMYGLNCILIDEADASMTPENAKLVYDFISELEDFSQIIFISHREESREAMKNSGRDNVIFYEVSDGTYNLINE